MATIFGAVTEGYKAADEMINVEEQSKARTSLLSTTAEASRMKLDNVKEEAKKRLAYLSGKAQASAENPTLDPTNLGSAIQLQNILINKYKQQPELQQAAYEEKNSLIKQQQEALKLQVIEREQQRADMYDTVARAIVDPDFAKQLSSNKDESLQHFGQLLTNQKPALLRGKPVFLKDMNEKDYKETVRRMVSPLAPKIDQGLVNRQDKLDFDYYKVQLDAENKALEASLIAQKIAAFREKQQQSDKAKKEKAETQTTIAVARLGEKKEKDLANFEKQQMEILVNAGLASPDDSNEILGMKYGELPAEQRAQYDAIEKQKARRISQYETDKAKLEAVHEGKPLPKEEPKEDPLGIR